MLCSGVYNPEEDRYVPHHQSETKEEITIVIKLQKGKTEYKGRLPTSNNFFWGGSLFRRKKKTLIEELNSLNNRRLRDLGVAGGRTTYQTRKTVKVQAWIQKRVYYF